MPVILHLFENGDYVWSLYISHLIIEKMLKAHYVKYNGKMPPKTHELIKLAVASNIKLEEEQLEFLDLVNEFNIEARYSEIKFNFYKKCTREFAETNISKIMELYKWLKSLIQL